MWKSTRQSGFCLTFMVTSAAIIVGTNAKPPSRIREGADAAPNEGTFVVRLSLNGPKGGGECTGAIISRRHILTAGHCTDNMTGGTVIGGTHHRSDQNPIISKIARLYEHPKYGTAYGGYDVGVIEVDSDLDLGGRQISAPLTTSEINFDRVGFVFGWSKCDGDGIMALQKLTVSFLTKEICNEHGGYDQYPQLLCVDAGLSGACPGDSGGPIVSNGRIVGILTLAANHRGEPLTAQNVYYYRDWINSIVNRRHE